MKGKYFIHDNKEQPGPCEGPHMKHVREALWEALACVAPFAQTCHSGASCRKYIRWRLRRWARYFRFALLVQVVSIQIICDKKRHAQTHAHAKRNQLFFFLTTKGTYGIYISSTKKPSAFGAFHGNGRVFVSLYLTLPHKHKVRKVYADNRVTQCIVRFREPPSRCDMYNPVVNIHFHWLKILLQMSGTPSRLNLWFSSCKWAFSSYRCKFAHNVSLICFHTDRR